MSEIISYGARLKQNLQKIESQVIELLDISTIKEFRNNRNSGVFFVTPPYYWGETNEQQKLLQMQLEPIRKLCLARFASRSYGQMRASFRIFYTSE